MNEDKNRKPEDQESQEPQEPKKDEKKNLPKKRKENGLMKGVKKIGKGGATLMSKVSKYPKIATTVILTAGIGLGYLLKTVVEIATSSQTEDGSPSAPIETEFADKDSGSSEESSPEE